MATRSFGRYLKGNLIRIIAVSALMILATILATRPRFKIEYCQTPDHESGSGACSQVDNDKILGIGADGWTAIFTGMLTLFTFVLAVVSITQIKYLIRADKNALVSADAAKKAADVAQSALEGIERPYVLFEIAGENLNVALNPNLPEELKGRRPFPLISYRLKNLGRSPAIIRRKMLYWVSIPYGETPDRVLPRWADGQGTIITGTYLIAAGDQSEILESPSMILPMGADDIVDVATQRKMIWALGVAIYSDPIGRTWRATVQFMYSIVAQTLMFRTHRDERYEGE